MSPATNGLRIVVTGLIAQHPLLGGVAWDYAQYAAGLRQLGHDVYYFEDSGEWPYTLDGGPSGREWIAYDCEPNVRHLAAVMERVGLADRWAYRFPIAPKWFGLSDAKRREVLRTADLLINVSGSLVTPSDYRRIPRLAYIDSDPVFTQIKLALPRGHLRFRRRVDAHHAHFTFGERLSSSVVPARHNWRPTRQPIVLSEWRRGGTPRDVYTTVMSWTSYRPLRYRGQTYGQKDAEFVHFLDLPGHVRPARLEVALSGRGHTGWQTADLAAVLRDSETIRSSEPSLEDLLKHRGWRVVHSLGVCAGLDAYRSYIQSSKGEWSVAKNGYVQGRSGWFSCRSACYLAAGRPVVVQDTGFSSVIPSGLGVLAFSTPVEAVAAVREVEGDYRRHSRAAREIAGGYFDSRLVLKQLVEEAMGSL